MSNSRTSPRESRFVRFYTSLALIVLNSVIVLVVINALVATAYRMAPLFRSQNPIAEKYGQAAVRKVYFGRDDVAIRDLLRETWSRPYVFEAFTQFKERTFRGKYVNVVEQGFRLTKDQGPWPPATGNLNIFMFGGSTTFGYGVADDETIASNLQDILEARSPRPVRVYNFGRGDYFSTQERLLFEQLLAGGFVPHIAIFVDGLNDFYYHDTPRFSNELAAVVAGNGSASRGASWSRFALGRALGSVSARLRNQSADVSSSNASAAASQEAAGDIVERVIARYLANKELIEAVAIAHRVSPVFIWQPVPTYKYDEHNHLFKGDDYGRHERSRVGYRVMKERMGAIPPEQRFFWLADIQAELREPLYVDQVHYSPRFSRIIAERVADVLITRGMVDHATRTMRN